MNDRELLEMAAKAAGLDARFYAEDSGWWVYREHEVSGYWNPLTDDGDALRLAVKLALNLYLDPSGCITVDGVDQIVEEQIGQPERATRRAIVRAAAEIGRAMS